MKQTKINRIYYNFSLEKNIEIHLVNDYYHYLIKVLRLGLGSYVKIFNEHNGEYLAKIIEVQKKALILVPEKKLREKSPSPLSSITLALALIKLPCYLTAIDMATQIGINKIIPIISDRTQLSSLNYDKLYKRIIEATEQSNRLSPPILSNSMCLKKLLADDQQKMVLYANEKEAPDNILIANASLKSQAEITVLIGPEGGFSENEIQLLHKQENFYSFSLGPNILRSETAAIAFLSQLLLHIKI